MLTCFPPTWRSIANLAVLYALLLLASPLQAATDCPGEHCIRVRPQDEVLLVSSRSIGCSTDETTLADGLKAERFQHVADPAGETAGQGTRRAWQSIDWREVTSTADLNIPTIIFAHGNRIAAHEVRNRGLYIYKRLMACAGDDRPVRFIIWSWDSAQINGQLRDYQVKAARTRPVAYQLAWLINQMPAEQPIGIYGYSYGARVASGTAHLLGGGSLSGLSLKCEGNSLPKRPMRHVWIAAALESDWLGPGRYHGRAMEQIDRLLLTTNRRDPAMRFFPMLGKQVDDRGLGYEGPTCATREAARKIRLIDMTKAVGRSHNLCEYAEVRSMMRKAYGYLSFADSQPTDAQPTVEFASKTAAAKPTVAR